MPRRSTWLLITPYSLSLTKPWIYLDLHLHSCRHHLREGVEQEGNFERHSDPLPEVASTRGTILHRERTERETLESIILVGVGGLPGAGKSVVARKIADRLQGLLLRTDVVRKELYPAPTYSEAENIAVYLEVRRRAEAALASGTSVVLDATFRLQSERESARQMAEKHRASWHFILVTAPEPLIRERLAQRSGDASDADFAIYEEIRDQYEPVEEPYLHVDNSADLAHIDQQLARVPFLQDINPR
jgi:predicted kinase